MTGGDGSPFALPPLLLGGVLKGDTSAASKEVSGANVARAAVSIECDLDGIFGLPARLTGGGTGGAEAAGRSPLRGSPDGAEAAFEENSGLESRAGVVLRLGILNVFAPVEGGNAGEGESKAAWDVGRDGRGEWI